MPTCLIAVGSNLEDPAANFARAVESLRSDPRLAVAAVSSPLLTRPVGGPPGQGEFVNGAIRLDTSLPPEELWQLLRSTERSLGRRRDARWGPRTIDLDLLLYGDFVSDSPVLIVPHPRMAVRRFVLEPAAEIAAELVHPVFRWTIGRMLDHLVQAPPYIAIAGADREFAAMLARSLHDARGGTLVGGTASELSGPQLDVALELLAGRVRMLDRDRFVDRGSLVVSDFWLEELLVQAELHLDDPALRAFTQQFVSTSHDVQSPKLVVLTVSPHSDATALRQSAEVESRLRRRLIEHPPCPWLSLPADRPDEAVAELIATVDGMR